MLAAMVLGAVLLPQQSITFTHACANSAVVLAALGKKLGVHMEPSGSVKKDYFLVSFDGVTEEEAFRRIALALNATWKEENGVTYLTRTHAQELAERQEVNRRQVAVVEDWLSKNVVKSELTAEELQDLVEQSLESAKPPNGYDPRAEAKYSQLEQQSPTGRYLRRLAQGIGAETIASTYEGDPIVYVKNPKGTERPFPQGEPERLFEKETAMLEGVLDKTKAVERWPSDGRYSSYVTPFNRLGYVFVDGGRLQLKIYNKSGNYYIELMMPGYHKTTLFISPGAEHANEVPNELTSLQAPYVPSPLEEGLKVQIAALMRVSTDFEPVSPDVAVVLDDPVENEPLSVLGSKWLLDSSELLHKNIIAVLDEEAPVIALSAMAQKAPTLGSIWTVLSRMSAHFHVTDEDGWITVLPAEPAKAREAHPDRFAWRAAIKEVMSNSSPSLDALSSVAALSEDDGGVMMAAFPAALQLGTDFFNEFTGMNVKLLRIYGKLEMKIRKAAESGGTEVPVASLSQSLRKSVLQLVADDTARVSIAPPERGWGVPDTIMYRKEDKAGPEVVAGGFPTGTVLRLQVLKQDVVYRQPQEGGRLGHGETPEDLGQEIAYEEANPGAYGAGLRPYFAVAPAEQLYLEIEFPGIGFFTRRVQVDHLAQDVVYKPVKELPDTIRQMIEKATNTYRDFYKKQKKGGGGS